MKYRSTSRAAFGRLCCFCCWVNTQESTLWPLECSVLHDQCRAVPFTIPPDISLFQRPGPLPEPLGIKHRSTQGRIFALMSIRYSPRSRILSYENLGRLLEVFAPTLIDLSVCEKYKAFSLALYELLDCQCEDA